MEAPLGQAARILWLVAACTWEHLCHGKAHPLLAGLPCCTPLSDKEEKKGKKIRSELLQSVRAQGYGLVAYGMAIFQTSKNIFQRPKFPGESLKFHRKSGKEKAHKHKQIFPVTARVGVSRSGGGGGLPTGWGGVSRPVARGQKFMCCVRNPRNINVFVRVPGREESGSRPGGSVTGVTEKLFMCQMFMCLLFRPLERAIFTKFQAPKFENSEPEKMQFHTPSHSIPPLDSLLSKETFQFPLQVRFLRHSVSWGFCRERP